MVLHLQHAGFTACAWTALRVWIWVKRWLVLCCTLQWLREVQGDSPAFAQTIQLSTMSEHNWQSHKQRYAWTSILSSLRSSGWSYWKILKSHQLAMSRALAGKNMDRRAAGQKEFATWGQKTCGSAPKASGLAEARGRLREPAEPNGAPLPPAPRKTHRFGDPERRGVPGDGGCVCLKSSHSHPVLFACADDPARSRGEVATGCHSHPTSEPLHGLLLGQGGRLKGGMAVIVTLRNNKI